MNNQESKKYEWLKICYLSKLKNSKTDSKPTVDNESHAGGEFSSR